MFSCTTNPEEPKELILKANKNELSFAIFKPTKIIAFEYVPTARQWPQAKLNLLKAKSKQLSLFSPAEEIEKEFLLVDKLPYKFSYKFVDDKRTKHELMIEDWDVGKLYWDRLNEAKKNAKIQVEKSALRDVEHKYYYEYEGKDVYFILGTLRLFHGWARNPFVIVGAFCLPVNK